MGKSSSAARGGSSTSRKQQTSSSTTTNSSNNKRGRASATDDDTTTMFSKKKKATTAGSSMTAAEPTSPSPSSTETAIMEMFKVIAEDPTDPNSQVNLDGITILGEKIGIDAAEDIRILILLWKLGVGITQNPTPSTISSKYSRSNSNPKPQTPQYSSNFIPGTIQASEWKYGCQNILHVDSWESLAALKPSLDVGFLETTEFRDFYKFCFRFNLNGTHKTLDNETTVALLQMIFGGSSSGRIDPIRFDTFIQFLEDPEKAKAYSKITLDQWMSFYDFCQEIPTNDGLLNSSLYDESTSAWPVLLDDYVDYIQQMKKG